MSAGQNKDEKKDILKTYFDGVIQHLQTEIDYVTKLIGHTGEMGRANEVILFNLLVKFLPKRYSVGSGIVIDKEGNRSKQIDIIIYDSYFQPELFAQSSTYLFPVDIVYMTIEVKTLLDKTRMSEALDNIASVKRLKFIETSIGFLQYHKPNTKIAASFNISKTRSPFGVIFSYKADTDDFNTYRSWLKPIEETKKNEIFDLSYNLQYTCMHLFEDLDKKDKMTEAIYKLEADRDIPVGSKKLYHNLADNRTYPIIDIGTYRYVVDPARGLLGFLFCINDLLSLKQIIRTNIVSEYFGDSRAFVLD